MTANALMSIQLRELSKYYSVHRKAAGLRGSLRNLFRREYETVKAVDGISFSIEQGEVVGFLGYYAETPSERARPASLST